MMVAGQFLGERQRPKGGLKLWEDLDQILYGDYIHFINQSIKLVYKGKHVTIKK